MTKQNISKILFISLLLFLFSCSDNKKYEVCYKIYYPNNVKTYIVIIDDKPYLGSDRGTNFLKVGSLTSPETLARTSAPIELVYYKEKEN